MWVHNDPHNFNLKGSVINHCPKSFKWATHDTIQIVRGFAWYLEDLRVREKYLRASAAAWAEVPTRIPSEIPGWSMWRRLSRVLLVIAGENQSH